LKSLPTPSPLLPNKSWSLKIQVTSIFSHVIHSKGAKSLGSLYNRINELPTRNDIKLLLRKCIYSILIDEDVNEEVKFLNEVKNLLIEAKHSDNLDHEEIISLIEDIYIFAVDKKIDENIRIDKEYKIPVYDELLSIFESSNIYNDLVEESGSHSPESEEIVSDEVAESCEYFSSQPQTPQRDDFDEAE